MIRTYLLLLLISLLSCHSDQDQSIRVFKYNQTDHITSLDPAFAKSQNNMWIIHHVFEGLVQLDDGLNIVPDIAKRWEISEDGKRYTFYLRDDVAYHENDCFGAERTRCVTAADVAYSFRRLIDPSVNSPGSWLFTDKVSSAESFQAVDDTTFRIELNAPFLPLLGILTMQYCSIVPHEAIEYYGSEWARNPVGTGPFRFKKWVENQAVFLERNQAYSRPINHNLDGIKTSFIPDKKIAYLELLNDNLHFVSGLESSFAPTLLTRDGQLQDEYKGKLNFQKAAYLNFEYLGINISNASVDSPLRKKAFRQALNYAIDRKLMLQSLRNGIGKPADSGCILFGLPGYDPIKSPGYIYDIVKARQLIRAAGYTDISQVPTIEVYTNNDYLDLTTFIAKQWEELGLRVSIEVKESGLLRQSMRNTELPLFRASWIADYPDAESFLCMFYSGYPAPPNYTSFHNEQYDLLYKQSIRESVLEKRLALYQQMDRILIEEAPVIFLFYDETALFSSTSVSGISSNAVNLLKVDSLKM